MSVLPPGSDLPLGVESEPVHLAEQRLHARFRVGTTARFDAPGTARGGGVGRVGTDPFGQHGQHPSQKCVARRVETEAGRARRQGVDVLGPADRAAVHGLDVDEAGFAQALEVEPDGVGVQAEAFGELGRGERRRWSLRAPDTWRSASRRRVPSRPPTGPFLDGTLQSGIFSRSRRVLLGAAAESLPFLAKPLWLRHRRATRRKDTMSEPTILPENPAQTVGVPTPDDVRGVLAGVLDPELRASIIELGMVHDVRVAPNGDVMVKVALDHRRLPAPGPDRHRRALQGLGPARRG